MPRRTGWRERPSFIRGTWTFRHSSFFTRAPTPAPNPPPRTAPMAPTVRPNDALPLAPDSHSQRKSAEAAPITTPAAPRRTAPVITPSLTARRRPVRASRRLTSRRATLRGVEPTFTTRPSGSTLSTSPTMRLPGASCPSVEMRTRSPTRSGGAAAAGPAKQARRVNRATADRVVTGILLGWCVGENVAQDGPRSPMEIPKEFRKRGRRGRCLTLVPRLVVAAPCSFKLTVCDLERCAASRVSWSLRSAESRRERRHSPPFIDVSRRRRSKARPSVRAFGPGLARLRDTLSAWRLRVDEEVEGWERVVGLEFEGGSVRVEGRRTPDGTWELRYSYDS